MLSASGELDLKMGGKPSQWDKCFVRRTVYGEVSRFRTERLLTLFDFPNPSIHAEKRIPTNTSVQRLFFLNSDFIRDRSAALAGLFDRPPGLRPRREFGRSTVSYSVAHPSLGRCMRPSSGSRTRKAPMASLRLRRSCSVPTNSSLSTDCYAR